MDTGLKARLGHKLIWYGLLLLLLGLLTGFLIPAMTNPRMGLSSHLEGMLNGMLLIIFGLIWTRMNIGDRALKAGFWIAIYGTFVNWATTFGAAVWGAGGEMMPFAGGDHTGAEWQEAIIAFGLISLSIAMIAVTVMLLWGLRKRQE